MVNFEFQSMLGETAGIERRQFHQLWIEIQNWL